MNTDAQILPLPTPESPHIGPASSSIQPSTNPSIPEPLPPRRNGKIAHLPKQQRDLINHLFDDGVTYEAVSRKLAEQGVTLNLKNLSDWYHGGYQDELQARERRDQLRLAQDHLLQLARQDDAPALSAVGLQLAITQLAQQLHDLAPGSHKDSFQTDTPSYLRMLNTLARMSKALLSFQKYRDAAAKSQAAELKQLDHDRDLSDKELELLVNKMDQVFKVRRRPPLAAPDPRDGGLAAPKQSNGGLGKQLGQGEEAFPPIQNQKSQIENPERRPSKILPRRKNEHSQIRNADSEPRQNSEIENGKKQSPEGSVRSESVPPKIENQKTRNQHSNARGRSSNRKSKFTKIENAAETSPSLPLGERVGERRSSERVPEIKNQKSEIENAPGPEPCHFCQPDLPALLPDGERPFANCQSCGITLHSPHNRHLYCPACASDLRMIIVNGQRILSSCPYCEAALPPWLPPTG